MPRQVAPEVRQKWIELADKGMTPSEIKKALGSGSDTRTIENAISRERADRASDAIRTKAYVEALAGHWAILGNSPDELVESVKHSQNRFGNRPAVYALVESDMVSSTWTAKRIPGRSEWKVRLRYPDSVEGQSLREHTGDGPFWRAVDSYAKYLEKFIKARLAIAKAVVESVKASTGYEVQDGGGERLEIVGLSNLDEDFFRAATGDEGRLGDIEASLRIDDGGKRLRLRGSIVVEVSSGMPRDIAKRFLEGLEGLKGGSEWKNCAASAMALERAADELEWEYALMRTMPALPGMCTACRRVA